MAHKKKIAMAAMTIILAGSMFIIFSDDSTGKDNTIEDKEIIKIKLAQGGNDKIKMAVDISSGQAIPLNEAISNGGGYFNLQRTKYVSKKRKPLDFLRGNKPHFAAVLAVNNMDLMKVPSKNGRPIRDFWKDTDTSQWPNSGWQQTSSYLWDAGPDEQDCLFKLYDGKMGIIRFYDTESNRLKIAYKIISKPGKPRSWGKSAIASLPNGAILEIMGTRKLGDESNKWIAPDGQPLAKAPYIRDREPFKTIKEGRAGYEFATRRFYPSLGYGGSSTGSVTSDNGRNYGSSSFSVKDEFGNSLYSIEANAYLFDQDARTARIRSGIAFGPWQTALSTKDEDAEAEIDGRYIKMYAAKETEKGFTIDVIRSHLWSKLSLKLSAVMYDGKEKYIDWDEMKDLNQGENKRSLYKYKHESQMHDPWGLIDVKEFRFQYREYDYITIDNISLIEGVNAGVKISTELSATTRKYSPAEPINLDGCSNLFKVADGLYRCAQPEDVGFTELEKLGIKTVVNLRAWHSDRSKLEQTDLAYVHIKMEAWDPEYDEIKQFLQIVTNPKNQPAAVHCLHGADRTGTMVACYRMVVQGWTKERALEEMKLGPFGFHEMWKGLPKFIDKLDVEQMRKDLGITVENKHD